MPNEDNPPEFLSLDPKADALISQGDLQYASGVEDALLAIRASIHRKLKTGAAVEPGQLELNPAILKLPVPRSVQRGADRPSRVSGKNEPSFDGGLTFSEQRMLRDLQTSGLFDAVRLNSIVDRIEGIAGELFADQREKMFVMGCFSMMKALKWKTKFSMLVGRVRTMILLHDLGITRVRGCVVEGMFDLNRAYYQVRAQRI